MFELVTLFLSALTVLATSLTVVAISVQACIFYGQLREMKKSTDAATKAANAAEASVKQASETAHLDQRAWVGPIHADGNLPAEVDKDFLISIQIKNSGKTFAKKVGVKWHTYPARKQEIPDFEKEMTSVPSETLNSVGLLPPQGESSIRVRCGPITPKAVLDVFRSDEIRYFIFGKITYVDVFDCPHWTTFCYVVKTDDPCEIWESYNDADDNRC